MSTNKRSSRSSIALASTLAPAFATLAGVLVGACGPVELADEPRVEAAFPYAVDVVIDSRLTIDVKVSGCRSGVDRIQLLQGDAVVRQLAGAELERTRHAVEVSRLALTGAAFPVSVELAARVRCASGAEARSEAASIELLPASGRLGGQDVRWPGYRFWLDGAGQLLFCSGKRLLRLDRDGKQLARSSREVDCSATTRLVLGSQQLLVLAKDSIRALDAQQLQERWSLSSGAPSSSGAPASSTGFAALSGGRLLTVARITDGKDSNGSKLTRMRVIEFSLKDGAVLWQSELDGPHQHSLVSQPILDDKGLVRVLTMSTSLSPLGGAILAWTIDPQQPGAPTSRELLRVAPTPIKGNQVFVGAFSGRILPGARAAVLAANPGLELNGVGHGRLMGIDLGSGQLLWQEDVAPRSGQVAFHAHGDRTLVRAGDALLVVGQGGAIARRFRAGSGATLREILAHSLAHSGAGGALVTVERGKRREVVLLDDALRQIWTVPFPWALGAAFDAKGTPYVLHADMVRLHGAKDYPGLLK